MKPRPPKAKRTLADFIRGTPVVPDPIDASETFELSDAETLMKMYEDGEAKAADGNPLLPAANDATLPGATSDEYGGQDFDDEYSVYDRPLESEYEQRWVDRDPSPSANSTSTNVSNPSAEKGTPPATDKPRKQKRSDLQGSTARASKKAKTETRRTPSLPNDSIDSMVGIVPPKKEIPGGNPGDAHSDATIPIPNAEPSPAPELVEAIVDLPDFQNVSDLWASGESICWEGAWLGAIAPIVAATQSRFQRPLLVLLAQHQDAETVARDIEFFLDEQDCEVFPPASDDTDVDSLQQQEVIQRLQVVTMLDRYRCDPRRTKPPVILSTLPALMHSVPSPDQLRNDRKTIQVGKKLDLAALKTWLVSSGYRSTTSVQLAGEFTARGGILDVFPPDALEPRRIELFDDEVESIRTFDSVTQRSISRMDRIDLLAVNEATKEEASLLDYLDPRTMVLYSEPTAGLHHAQAFRARVPFPERFSDPIELYGRLQSFSFAQISQLAADGYQGTLHRLPLNDVQRIGGELENLPKEIDSALGSERVAAIVCMNEGELARIHDIAKSSRAHQENRLRLVIGILSSGFEIPGHGALILTVNQLLRRSMLKRSSRKHASRAIDSFLDLREGDLVVHLSHGIGIYLGMEFIENQGQKFEHLTIEFDGGTKIYVPASKIDLVQRYVGGTKTRPKLAKIGSQTWVRQKKAAEKAVQDMAADLLELQAQRRSLVGIQFKPDSVWQQQFEASFPYEETPDQLTAIAALKKDMMSTRPMERLICGDVGFGKTEVAMRAAFKAVESGYQVAVLVPTTVLAEQHYKTFKQRMAEFPFSIAKLSRFESASAQKETSKRIANGQVDIVVGTHRLASADVQFFNLGLLIIDEEQKFGVELKERLKKVASKVDVLTLSATPIPRTLHMSLVGIRDISNLETAPEERMAVETRVVRWNDALIRNAILRELNRDGQMFFVHNRIEDMHSVAARLQRIAPEARIVIGHGQMGEGQLEQVMLDFIEHRADILLSTTIIESGLDISNANTIFIDQADRYGLSELHQLRGRVGRYRNQAHCYLLVDRNKHLNPEAARRLHAIEEFSQLGAGFGIAMRDLEIRGAGNLLGTQQSGHIAAVGYELYCQLLESAVRQLTRQPPKLSLDVDVNLPLEAYLPSDYVVDMRQKIDLYRRVSRLQDVQAISDIRQELLDRFGALPKPAKRLLEIAELKMDATLWSIRYIGIEDNYLCFAYTDPQRIEQLARRHPGKLRIVDREKAYWPLWETASVNGNAAALDKSRGKNQPWNASGKPGSWNDRSMRSAPATPQQSPPAEAAKLTDAKRLASIDLLAVLRQVLRLT